MNIRPIESLPDWYNIATAWMAGTTSVMLLFLSLFLLYNVVRAYRDSLEEYVIFHTIVSIAVFCGAVVMLIQAIKVIIL